MRSTFGRSRQRPRPTLAVEIAAEHVSHLGADRDSVRADRRRKDPDIGLNRVTLAPLVVLVRGRDEHLPEDGSREPEGPPSPPKRGRRAGPSTPENGEDRDGQDEPRVTCVPDRPAEKRRIGEEAGVTERVQRIENRDELVHREAQPNERDEER